MEEPGMDSLPDEAILSIFSDLEEARNVASLAPVCRRWRDLSRYVESLHFNPTKPSEAAAVASMLRRAPALKHLTITESHSHKLTEKQLYTWIHIVKHTLQVLDVTTICDTNTYNDLWEELRSCSRLTTVRVHGRLGLIMGAFITFFPPLQFDMPNLRECVLDDSTSMKFPVVATLMSHCLGLEKLVVTNFPSMKAKLFHNNVRHIEFGAEEPRQPGAPGPLIRHQPEEPQPEGAPPFILLETASLEYLKLDGVSCVLYAPRLTELHLPSRCKDLIVVSLDNVDLLTMGGDTWEFKEIHSVVELVPNISRMSLDVSVVDPEAVVWKSFFHGLSRLESLVLGGNMLPCFCKEIDIDVVSSLKLVRVTVFVEDDGCLELAQALLSHCSTLKVLKLNCSKLVEKCVEGGGLKPMQLLEARYPQLACDLQKLEESSTRVHLCF